MKGKRDIELAPVRLAETGVCSRFLMKTGTVTAVNICGHGDSFRMAIMRGEAIPCGMEFPGNPVKIHFEKSVVDEVLCYHMKNVLKCYNYRMKSVDHSSGEIDLRLYEVNI